MRTLADLICSSLAHFGDELSLIEIADLVERYDLDLDNKDDAEYREEVSRLLREMRHKLGAALQDSRRLRDLLKYGVDRRE